jgi:hypothetical protein
MPRTRGQIPWRNQCPDL